MADRTTGIVLSGGASYGAYEVGVALALMRGMTRLTGYKEIQPEVFSGTSAGAFNAALLTSESFRGAKAAAEHLKAVWLEKVADSVVRPAGAVSFRLDPRKYLNPNYVFPAPFEALSEFADDLETVIAKLVKLLERFSVSRETLTARLIDLFDFNVLISAAPLGQLMKEEVSFARIRSGNIRLRITATDWNNGTARTFRNEEMTDEDGLSLLLASNAIPGVFPTQQIGKSVYVDGGVVMNTPLKPAIEAGANEIHIVSVNPSFQDDVSEVHGFAPTLYRTVAIVLENSIRSDVEQAARLNAGIRAITSRLSLSRYDKEALRGTMLLAGSQPRRENPTIPYRPVTIHRHILRNCDSNFSSVLDFSRSRVQSLILQGVDDARAHDCGRNQCVLA